MPVSGLINNWKNITDVLKNKLSNEFGKKLPIYIGEGDYADNQFLKILPTSYSLEEQHMTSNIREYLFDFILYSTGGKSERESLSAIMRIISRMESFVGNNRSISLSDGSSIFESSLTSYEFDEGSDVYKYIVNIEFTCMHYWNKT
tara:strand:+ start:882 stop:1319 length:438 start_codon:yes stop_codon:yes gene_type:complete